VWQDCALALQYNTYKITDCCHPRSNSLRLWFTDFLWDDTVSNGGCLNDCRDGTGISSYILEIDSTSCGLLPSRGNWGSVQKSQWSEHTCPINTMITTRNVCVKAKTLVPKLVMYDLYRFTMGLLRYFTKRNPLNTFKNN